MKLEQLTKGARVRGLAVDGIATVKSVELQGSNAVEVIFTDARGALQVRLLMREDEPSLELVTASRPWSFQRAEKTFSYWFESAEGFVKLSTLATGEGLNDHAAFLLQTEA